MLSFRLSADPGQGFSKLFMVDSCKTHRDLSKYVYVIGFFRNLAFLEKTRQIWKFRFTLMTTSFLSFLEMTMANFETRIKNSTLKNDKGISKNDIWHFKKFFNENYILIMTVVILRKLKNIFEFLSKN